MKEILEVHVKEFIMNNKLEECKKITERQRAILYLRHQQNLSYRQIGEKIGRTGNLCRTQNLLGLEKIRLHLNSCDKNTKISETTLDKRIKNCLEGLNITKLSELDQFPLSVLKKCRNLGRVSIIKLQAFLNERGIFLNDDIDFYQERPPRKKTMSEEIINKLKYLSTYQLQETCKFIDNIYNNR